MKRMDLPIKLRTEIIDFLTSLPNMSAIDARRALIFSAGFDRALQDQITFSGPKAQFFTLFVQTLCDYGELSSGTNPIIAILETAKRCVGEDRKKYCDTLIQAVELVQVGLRVLLDRMQDDLEIRTKELQQGSPRTSRQWFIQEISRCNIGESYYIDRWVNIDGERNRFGEVVSDWLTCERQPYLFVLGPSGIGKTNSLIAEVLAPSVEKNITLSKNSQPLNQAIVFFRLGTYDPEQGLTFWSNFEELVTSRIRPSTELGLTEESFRKLVENGTILLIFDGLDEFMRVHGEEGYGYLSFVFHDYVGKDTPKVIISCRDHIYESLKGRSLFRHLFEPQRSKVIKINRLEDDEVKEALEKRPGVSSRGKQLLTDHQALSKLEGSPLLLEMMCGIPEKAWCQLHDKSDRADLYDLWFEEIIRNNNQDEEHLCNVEPAEIRERIGEIAIRMLAKRSDLVQESIYQEEKLLPIEIDSRKQKLLGIFIKQTKSEWGFVHDSFREFSLAKKLADELLSSEYDFLKRTASFDFVGTEIYQFVYQLLQASGGYVEPITKALESSNTLTSHYPEEQWNNIVRNCFEAIGMIADDDLEDLEKSIERPGLFIQMAKKFLCLPSESESIILSDKTKYNIVRCLARLHPSGQKRPYFQHDRRIDWRKPPSLTRFGTWVVQGFHRRIPKVRLFPPTIVRPAHNDCSTTYQKDVSECLIFLLQASVDQAAPEEEKRDCRFLRVNASFALIRWLHKDHLDKLRKSLEYVQRDPEIKGNLFLAVFRLGDEGVFEKFPHSFDGMKLRWIPAEIKKAADEANYEGCDIKPGPGLKSTSGIEV